MRAKKMMILMKKKKKKRRRKKKRIGSQVAYKDFLWVNNINHCQSPLQAD